MTREIIEDFRFIVIPYMVNRFKEINYEGQGGSDAKEFMNNFNEICDLAIKALDQDPTTKNDLGVDCISRAEAIKCLECDFNITGKENMKTVVNYINSAHDKIVNLPRVKQEPFKLVEIDLDYVIKQKYIEREVLDKIRAEIAENIEFNKKMNYMGIVSGLALAKDVIDKYKA